ncbi:hypothetical protein CKM354_000233300 [Cercospora kikuchii]|uniref:Nucleoporin NUP53 n=1 Tax=Cercospora kikuchii TaxID=84275 RepID=A0A9P3CFD7_9PEZI|nr:uncharacterized protein CKM354_000233300 [Cercospora kikuchii]GIZ38935.1 hypothetical protein CKM354_000233300 [Cercospora kikuchii]
MYQAYSLRQQHRPPGMQIHAVPESERAIDSTGRKLPWGYDYSGPIQVESDRSTPVEKGPFGKSMRSMRRANSRSRSTTAVPRQNEDARARQEQLAAEDAVFGSLRRVNTASKEQSSPDGTTQPANENARAPAPPIEGESEPTEVFLFGFGEDMQWAAIDFYERVSGGIVLEDYDRTPNGARFDVSKVRQAAQRSLSRAALKKKNTYRGGNSWIKVTFDTRQAAELAVARSPHTIKGYLVYAEYFTGKGPSKDEAIHATQAGAQLTSEILPRSLNTEAPILEGDDSSQTATSATATNATSAAPSRSGRGGISGLPWSVASIMQDSPTNSSSTMQNGARNNNASYEMEQIPNTPTPVQTSSFQPRDGAPVVQHRPSRLLEGTVRLVPKAPELALAPKQPKASWTSWLGTGEIIGGAVPRKVDGSFDWELASLYWRFFAWIDWLFGTDLCGLKADE